MQEFIQTIADNKEFPLLATFALGLLTAIAPCPLATNITATAFIAKTINSKKKVIFSGILYTLGRLVSYTTLAAIVYFGASKFHLAKFFQGNGEKYIGFLMIFIGLLMLNVIKLNIFKGVSVSEKLTEKFKTKGLLGSFVLGVLFALAFCPYSGALYFGVLLPMTIASPETLLLPISFSIGTGVPVIFFAFIIAFSLEKLGIYFNAITKFEKWMRIFAGLIFILTGLYYINIFFEII